MAKTMEDLEIIHPLEKKGYEVNNENFQDVGRVHDWRNYVSKDVRKIWPHLSLLTMGIIYKMCNDRAEGEVWDAYER